MIRKYEEKDLDELLDVWYRASLVAHSFLSDGFFEQERKNIREIYMDMAETWVYEEGGRVVGFISLIENEVGAIFVLPESQGKGIGRKLMDKARELYGVLEVEVFAENIQARQFYEHYGFVAFREYTHEETGFKQVRMRLEK